MPSVLSVLLLVSGALAFFSMRLDSATDDEPAHVAAGYFKLAYGRFDFYNEQPPLINSLSALPLLGGHYKLPEGWDAPGANPWRMGEKFLYRSGNDADGILLRARLPIVVLFLLLSLLVYRFVLELSGSRAAALLGFALTAFCPNLLAHGRLATVDLGASLFCTATAFTFLRFLRSPTTARACVAGVCFGLTVLTKVSSLMVVPWAALIGGIFLLGERHRWEQIAAKALPRMLLVVVVAFATFEAVYLAEMRTLDLMAPFTEYGKSIATVFRWVSDAYGKPQYLLGSFSPTGWWFYYPVAFLLKTPLTTILLIAISLGSLVVTPLERRLEVWALLAFVAILLGASCTSRMNIGLRHILPIYPFLYVITGTLAPRVVRSTAEAWRGTVADGIALLACGSVAAGVAGFPSYISYFTEPVRMEDADHYLIDSNLDWGQDLRRLALWVNENEIPVIHTWYFGGSDPAYYLGDKARLLTRCEVTDPGFYAISRHYYRSSVECEPRFQGARHVTTIGDSILVFEVSR